MASNAVGLNESITFGPASRQAPYRYRAGMGMIPSAEFTVFMDDFVGGVASNVPAGWSAAIIDTGATVTSYTTHLAGTQGLIQISDATLSEGAAIYLPKTVRLATGKKFIMEARVYTDDVTDNILQFGLSSLTATTNPEDLWTTTATDVIALGLLDGAATVSMLSDAGNSGTSAQVGTRSMTASTLHTLAIEYTGSKLYGYVDGKQTIEWSGAASTIPTGVSLAPFIGHINGNGAGGNTVLVDYVRFIAER